MPTNEQFLSKQQRYRPISLPQKFSDEELVRDWTLLKHDRKVLRNFRRAFRCSLAIQLCAVRLYGRFLPNLQTVSPRIGHYLAEQLGLPPSLRIEAPDREATLLEHRQVILRHLGFKKFDEEVQEALEVWLEQQAHLGLLPDELFHKAEHYLLDRRVLLPGPSTLERLIIHIGTDVHGQLFEAVYQRLSPELRLAIDRLLLVPQDEQRSSFYQLKEYPPAATISSIQTYLQRYRMVAETGIDAFDLQVMTSMFLVYFFKVTKRYSAADLKRFADHKRYALLVCFLLETHKDLLDHLIRMHDQNILDLCRHAKHHYEKQHRALRTRQKRAIDMVVTTTRWFLDWPDEQPLVKDLFWQHVDERKLRTSLETLQTFQQLEEGGYGDVLLSRYPSLRKYFSEFLLLPFAVERGSEPLLRAITILRKLDAGELSTIPRNAPTDFVPKGLRLALKTATGAINRNAWETGLAIAMKDALRSGDLYVPHSKQHVSFWDLTLSDSRWETVRAASCTALQQPHKQEVMALLTQRFHEACALANQRYPHDDFAEILDGMLKLKRDDKANIAPSVGVLQKMIDARLPIIRIEQLLVEVDRLTGFTRHFTPVSGHHAKPAHFYRTLLATLISQATNLGVVSMSASVKGIPIDQLRHVLHDFVREDTLTAASAEIVNRHHALPLSALHGTGSLSSSDAQRFGVRPSSLLASYYPRYYGYYEKAIGIYTHLSDQYSVFSTQVIFCGPLEALYVLDGLLENNTVLPIRELKDQQLYRVERKAEYGVFAPLLNKTIDLQSIHEQWEEMIRVAVSLKQRTAPAHIIVQRLTTSFPSDRLSKAFTHLGRLIKTQYILRYLTDEPLRRTVQLQLNKGEYRHRLPRRIFFADQGEFTTGDYEEIMNKASCLSLVSNAILYWNTRKIQKIIDRLTATGEKVDPEDLSHISLLPFKHVVPNGTYFIKEK